MIYNQQHLEAYMKEDNILKLLKSNETERDLAFRSHLWLKEMENKRMIYQDMYGDLLLEKGEKRVLDIGGGYHR